MPLLPRIVVSPADPHPEDPRTCSTDNRHDHARCGRNVLSAVLVALFPQFGLCQQLPVALLFVLT